MKPITLNLTITTDEDILVGLIERAVFNAMGIDQQREARLRQSRHANYGGQKPPEDMGLLIDSVQASKLLKVSPRTLFTMYTTGQMPQPIRIGKVVRWGYEELQAWVNAGCPEKDQWNWPK